jgi:hypothetical protein
VRSVELLMFVAIRFRYESCGRVVPWGLVEVTHVEGQASTPQRRGVGRRSKLVVYTPWVEQWLREKPDVSGAEILSRVRRAGYRGGKSALYELVRRLRVLGDNPGDRLT